jgi:hypothetical protein
MILQNDLDLDLICRSIIHVSVAQLRHARCLNAYFSPNDKAKVKHKHRSMTVTETTTTKFHDDEPHPAQ